MALKKSLWKNISFGAVFSPVLALALVLVNNQVQKGNANAGYFLEKVIIGFLAFGVFCTFACLCKGIVNKEKRIFLAGLVGLVMASGLIFHDVYTHQDRTTYIGANGSIQLYRTRLPNGKLPSKDTPILIYLHGADGTENQGMDDPKYLPLFQPLHRVLDQKQWILVCPRGREFEKLKENLVAKFGPRDIFLSGASMGGDWAFTEANKNPQRFCGVILLCPAIVYAGGPSVQNVLDLPSWILWGEKDNLVNGSCRRLEKDLVRLKRTCITREIPNGDHGSPLSDIDWQKAIEFMESNRNR